jgi:hypothetical protein
MLLNSLYNRNKNESIESGTFIAKRISEEIEIAAREKYMIYHLMFNFMLFISFILYFKRI